MFRLTDLHEYPHNGPMTTAITLNKHHVNAGYVRPGDTITAIDGRALARPLVVDQSAFCFVARDTQGVRLVNPTDSGVEWVLYPDTQVETNITIERQGEPSPRPTAPVPTAAPETPAKPFRINARSWRKLPDVKPGFYRVPDAPDGTRQVECEKCGKKIPSLGIGYHLGGGRRNVRPCTER